MSTQTASKHRTLWALICVLGSATGFVTSASADTYMWVDNNGVVNYAERVPRGVPLDRVTRVSDNSLGPSSTPPQALPEITSRSQARQQNTADNEDLNEDQQEMLAELQSAEQNRQAQVAKIRQDNCERARRVLANLNGTGRIRVVGDDGERRVLDENDRSQRIAEAQRGIATNCDS